MRHRPHRLLLCWSLAIASALSLQANESTVETSSNPTLLPSEERELRQNTKVEEKRGDGENFSPRGGMGKGSNGPISITTGFAPRQSITSQPYSLGFATAGVCVGIPLWMPGGPIFTTSVQQTWFDIHGGGANTPLRLPRTGSIFPDSLTNVNFGLMFRKKFDNGWSGILGLNFGSASDKPFHSIRELTGGMFGSITVPLERDAWVFSVFYSPTSQLWFPVPGIAYRWKPNDELTMNIGLPFSVEYRPDDVWTFEANYLPVTNFSAKITAKVDDHGSIYLGYFIRNESYFLADRVEYLDRFMVFDQRVTLGLNVPIWRKWSADLSTGYAFGRYFYEGQNSIGPSEDRLYLGSGMFVNLQVGLQF